MRSVCALALVMVAHLVGCGDDACRSDADCPSGRICNVNTGLCALDPNSALGADALGDGLTVSLDCTAAVPGDLVINEILADPGSLDVDGDGVPNATKDEFVEVVNVSGQTVGLANVQLRVSGETNIPLGAYCLAPDQARVIFGSERSLGLANSGDTVALVVDEAVTQLVTFGSEGGKDQSLTLARQLDTSSDWVLHEDLFGTKWSPGACADGSSFPCAVTDPTGDGQGACEPVRSGELVLNEILADPAGQDVNGDGMATATSDEFVELVNLSTQSVGLINAKLVIDGDELVFGNVCVPPQGVHLVFGAEQSLGLANSGGSLQLLIDDEVVQEHTYGSEGGKDQSLTLATQGDPSSGWVSHLDISSEPWSPGTCANGSAFPNCSGGSPTDPDASDGGSAACGAAPMVGQVLINEILADPGPNDANGDGMTDGEADEFIEIASLVDEPLDLSGVVLRESAGKEYRFPDGSCLAPRGGAVMFGRYAEGGSFCGALVVSYDGVFGLNNGGDTVSLIAADGTVLDSHTYGSEAGQDQSITRANDQSLNAGFVKHSAAALSGGAVMSPGCCQGGQALGQCPAGPTSPDSDAFTGDGWTSEDAGPVDPPCGPGPGPDDLVINEVLADPGAVNDPNQDGVSDNGDEFVEILNLSGGVLDLSGVALHDEVKEVFTVTQGVCLNPGQALVIFASASSDLALGGALVLADGGSSLALNNGGDALTLFNAAAEIIDAMSYGAEGGQSESLTRAIDGDRSAAWVLHSELPAAQGMAMSPGRCSNGANFPNCL